MAELATVEGMDLPDIETAWLNLKVKKITQYPQNNLRASSVGKACDRFHYYSIKNWQERPLHGPDLQGIFDEGNRHETAANIELMEMGFEIVEQQRSFQIDKPLITTTIDGKLRWNKSKFPYEVKSMDDAIFQQINKAEDMLRSPRAYLRNYPAQLQTYLLATEEEVGCFILRSKRSGRLKPIWMRLDYAYMEDILQRAERVYKAIAANEPPERCNDFDLCEYCPFKAICLPDIKQGKGVKVLDDFEIAAMLERREQLKALFKEYEDIDEMVKDNVKANGAGDYVLGDFLVRIKEIHQKRKVAITFNEVETSYLKADIVRIQGKDAKGNG